MKFRTDFVTNSSSSSFIAVTATRKNGQVVEGSIKCGTDYHEIPLIEGELEENLSTLKEVIESSRDAFDLCDKIYRELLYTYHTANDKLDSIRDLETLDDLATIQLKGSQEGSNGGHFDFTYDFTTKEATGNMDYKYYYEEPTGKELIIKRCDYKGELERDGVFEIVEGILKKYNGKDTDVIVPDGVIGIGPMAFFASYTVENVYLPEGIRFIDRVAFYNCQRLRCINLPKGLERIGAGAFSGCSQIEKLDLPSSLFEIDVECFKEMKSLKSIVVPEGITEIPYQAFYYCEGLEEVSLPSTIEHIDEYAFSCCSKLKEIKIPDQVAEIDVDAFSGCHDIKRFYISKCGVKISSSLFNGMEKLEEIIVDEENENYKSVDGVLYTKDGKRLVRYPEGKGDKEYTVKEGTRFISEYAFLSSKNLEKINLPTGLERIGIDALSCMKRLEKIEIPDSIKSISNGAFDACESLVEIIIPKDFDLDEDTYDYWRESVKITKR